MGSRGFSGNILTIRNYLLDFSIYTLFSLLSSAVEGLSISILPLILRVLLSADEQMNLVPMLKPFERILENFLSGEPLSDIKNISFIVASIFLLKLVLNSLKKFSILRLQEGISRDLRDRVFSSLVMANVQDLRSIKYGEIVSRITNEMNNIRLAIRDGFGSLIGDGLNLFVFVLLAITSAPILSMFAWGILISASILGWIISRFVKSRALKALEKLASITSFISNTLEGLKVIKSLNWENKILGEFKRLSRDLYWKYLKLEFLAAFAPILSESLVGLSAALILLIAGYFIYEANILSPDAFVVFLASSLSTIRPMKLVFQSLAYIQTARVSLNRLREIYDLPKERWGDKDPRDWKVLEIEDLRIGHDGRVLLHIPYLRIERGERIAIVGRSGSGKSTFVETLMGFVKPISGRILLDGISIYEYDLHKWRESVGFVSQEAYIFDWKLKENLGEGLKLLKELSLEHLKDRLEENVANLKDKLSGGVKQRINIARVLAKKPSMIIMDEPTSHLDERSERELMNLVERLPKNTTVIIISHKPSTIGWARRTLEFENGSLYDNL